MKSSCHRWRPEHNGTENYNSQKQSWRSGLERRQELDNGVASQRQ